MSAPLIWVIFPGIAATILFSLRRWRIAVNLTAILLSLLLAILAWQLPLGEFIPLGMGLRQVEVNPSMVVLGRIITLGNGHRPILILIYLGACLWFGGATVAKTERLFVPLGLGICALVSASLAVTPLLFSALIIEILALVCVPVLSPPGRPLSKGVLRFLCFQTLGMCFLLIGDWLLANAETGIGSIILAAIFVGIGLAMMVALIPFHSWVIMLGEQTHPCQSTFIFYMFPAAVLFMATSYINRFVDIGASPALLESMRLIASLTVLIGGFWATMQQHLGRMLSYAAIAQIGIAFLAATLVDSQGVSVPLIGLLFALRIPHGLSLAIWGLALGIIRDQSPPLLDMNFDQTKGAGNRFPLATASLFIAICSMVGVPLFAGFPALMALFSSLNQNPPIIVFSSLLGNVLLIAAALRAVGNLISAPQINGWKISENKTQSLLMILGWGLCFVVGLTPQWFFPYLISMGYLFLNPPP